MSTEGARSGDSATPNPVRAEQPEGKGAGIVHGSIAHRLYCEIACNGDPECFNALDIATQRRWVDGVEKVLASAPAAPGAGVDEVEYEFEVWQDDAMQAGGSTTDYATAKDEADHYALMYGQDGPVEVRMYEKRRIVAALAGKEGAK